MLGEKTTTELSVVLAYVRIQWTGFNIHGIYL